MSLNVKTSHDDHFEEHHLLIFKVRNSEERCKASD